MDTHFVKHRKPCPKCNSSDAVSINQDGSAKCFSCTTFFPKFDSPSNVERIVTEKNHVMDVAEGEFASLKDRNISLETAKKYNVRVTKNDKGYINSHRYPYYVENDLVGYKIRKRDKNFAWEGQSTAVGLFGQQLFKGKGKYVTLTEGECDAMAAYELTGSKWPCVSIRSGAGGAVRDVQNNLEFLESFENVIINFDSDKQGREAAKKVARLLSPGKAKLMLLPDEFKDANDVLKANKHSVYTTAWWAAKTYTPSGVYNLSDKREDYHDRPRKESLPFPWEGLNNKIYGLRQGELITFTGGTGLGKSSVTRELSHWLVTHTEDNVGIIALEEDWHRTVDGILSIEANAKLHIEQEREMFSKDDLNVLYDKVFMGKNKDRVWIHSHLGLHNIDELFSKLRFMIVGCGCKWIVLDHLHMLVLSMVDGDERQGIDHIMGRLRELVEETHAGLILVSHLRRVDGNRGHENGIETSLSHLRGSQSIAQVSDTVCSIERDQQADCPIEANTSKIRVLKCRYSGDVGLATSLLYDKVTGRLSEVELDTEDELTGETL